MNWLFENWSLLVVIACALGVGFFYAMKFAKMDTANKAQAVKSWLLFAVLEAERIYKSGTGTYKLHYVYNLFVEKFGAFAMLVSFETFASWVDEVLIEMRRILETNKDIEAFIDNE